MSDEPKKFCIISDDDGHNYVCPADRAEEAQKMFEAISSYWSIGNYEKDAPPEPDFVEAVGGSVKQVEFTNYWIL